MPLECTQTTVSSLSGRKFHTGARGERLLKHYFYARPARRHEDMEVGGDKPASDRYKAGSAALGLSYGACFVPVAGGFVLTDTLILMPARRPSVEIALQKAFSPRAGGNFLPLSDETVV